MTAATLYIELLDRGLHLRIDEGDRLIVGPSSLLAGVDRANIRRHRDELAAMVAVDTSQDDQDELDVAPAPRRIHDVPSTCLGPTACAVLGICGRATCLTAAEHGAFEVAVFNARAERNPHRVTRLIDPQDISKVPATKEADRAA